MKILQIVNEIELNIKSYNAVNLAVSLKKSGHQVIMMCPEDSYACKEAAKYKIEQLSFGFLEKIGFIKIPPVDVVDFFSTFPTLPFVIKKMNKPGVPVFLRQFDFMTEDYYKKIKEIESLVYKFLPACRSISDEMSANGLSRERIFEVYPALNIIRWESAKLIKAAMFVKRPFKIGMSYRIINQKELELFLEIAKTVIDQIPNVNFVMVGPRYEKIRDIAREKGISHKIDMLDWRTDMPEVMAMIHVFIKTNFEPSVSRSLIEAMASGVPCVVPRVKGLTDFVINELNGVIVEPGNISEYASAIKNFIGDPPRCQAISATAFNYINDNMSLPVISNLMKVLYEEALEVNLKRK